ncbi:MAG: hypothetical protein EBS29_07765 [Chloroflexia bacterium]|nr:hypothetical protein [Chloroflexia bacterium]
MRLSEEKIYRIAERLHDELHARGLLIYKDPAGSKPLAARGLRIRAILDYITADLRIEDDIDIEVEKILASYQRTLRPSERDILRRKHKEEIARRQNYEL